METYNPQGEYPCCHEFAGRPIVSQHSADPILSDNQNILRITADPTHVHHPQAIIVVVL